MADWRRPFARVRSSSSTRLGSPAYTAGWKKLVAIPATRARRMICKTDVVNGNAQNTPALARSAAISTRRRGRRSMSGPIRSPITTIGANSTTRSALTHAALPVRS
jgi:hypothetical protein